MILILLITAIPLLYIYPKLITTLLFTTITVYNFYWKRRNLPPGPPPLPLVGNLLAIMNKDKVLDKLISFSKTYGPIQTFWLGETPFIFITDFDIMQKYFVKNGEKYAGRPANRYMLELFRGGDCGVIFTSGERWREQRRFALHTLRNFGMGKNQMEERILIEIIYFFDKIDCSLKTSNDEIDLIGIIDLAVGSLINAIICGYRFTIENREKEFDVHKERTQQIVRSTLNPVVELALRHPWMTNIWPISEKIKEVEETMKGAFEFIDGQIKQHLDECDYDHEFPPRDFMDAFLLARARNEREGGDESVRFSLLQLRGVCLDLWLAGQESTSSSLGWVFAYLIHYPEVQAKVHEELDHVIGSERLIVTSDKSNLPFINAAIAEALRCANLLIIMIPRATTEEVDLEGYTLPAESFVVPQLSVLFRDENYFPDPFAFQPERFIDDSGNFKSIDQYIPFSLGKRQCPGEGMARAEMFLFAANIVNRYRLLPGKEMPALKKITPESPAHAPFTCKLELRH